MPDLKRYSNSTNLLKTPGNTLAISSECCCDPDEPYYFCFGCPQGSTFPPDLVLDEVTYTISGYRNVSDFSAELITNARGSNAWKNLDLFNGTYVLPVTHGSTPLGGQSSVSLGTLYRRRANFNNPCNAISGETLHPSGCTGFGPAFPNWTVCPPGIFTPFAPSFNSCCCETTHGAFATMTNCGDLHLTYELPAGPGSNWSFFFSWLKINVAGITYLNPPSTRSVPWTGSRCDGSLSASFQLPHFNFADAFAEDRCAHCTPTSPIPTLYTISITASLSFVPYP